MLHRFTLPLCSLYTLLALATSCGTRPSVSRDSRSEAHSASDTVAGPRVDAQAVAAAYRQRLRLGLGSPYRLIETAMRDERLGAMRSQVARDLLAQIDRGALYEVTPLALVAAGVPGPNATAQFELIRQAVEGTPDARVGELAVKLAYELAALEHTVSPELVARIARIAALLRDRQLALNDGERLYVSARRLAVAPENLVLMWRGERAFAVEQPTMVPLDAAAQEEAARLALLLVGGIRAAVTPVVSTLQRTVADVPAQLPDDVVAALAQDTTGRRPQNALIITLRAIQAAAEDAGTPLDAPHWQEFFERVADEESLVVELARARRTARDDVVAAGVALDAAIALRPFAHEMLGTSAPVSAQDLQSRFGVRVAFDARVPEADRKHTTAMLSSALDDLRLVIRSLDLSGLTFRIAPLDPRATHLAYHEPRKRVIHLDPATAAGTIAHEVAHDLDWQLAARRYRTRSHYATDYAMRHHRTLAYEVQNLVNSAAPMNKPSPDDPSARRPAEIFARRFEWYVASALAQQGRSNGYLSSAQDDWIAGYGAAVRPDPAPTAAKSFAAILADAARMDRASAAQVERTVRESVPVAVRVLARVARSGNPAIFERESLADVAAWECGSTWQPQASAGAALRWYVHALSRAAFQPSVTALAAAPAPNPFRQGVQPSGSARDASVRANACASVIGVTFANPF